MSKCFIEGVNLLAIIFFTLDRNALKLTFQVLAEFFLLKSVATFGHRTFSPFFQNRLGTSTAKALTTISILNGVEWNRSTQLAG